MRSLATSGNLRIPEWSKSVPRDSFPPLGDAMAGAAGPVDELLAGILDVVLQGGQAGAAAEAPGEFGRGWEPNPSPEPTQCCGFGQVTQLCILPWAGGEAKNVYPRASLGLILQVSVIPRAFAQTSVGFPLSLSRSPPGQSV